MSFIRSGGSRPLGVMGRPGMGDVYLHRPRGSVSIIGPRALAGGCGCRGGGGCCGPGSGVPGGMGDAAPAPDLSSLSAQVADIQSSAKTYIAQDARLRYMQMGATLLIPLAALVTKGILHLRRGDSIF